MDEAKEDSQPIESCTIMATGANELMGSIHHRMLVFLDEKTGEMCLNTKIDEATILNPILLPYDSDTIEAYPIRVLVKNPSNDRPVYIQAE